MNLGKNLQKYCLGLEKSRGQNKVWNQINNKKGKKKHGIPNILKEQKKCYSKLLKSEGWDKKVTEKTLKNLNKLLTNEQKQMCDSPISLNELSKAVKQRKKEKSPGLDGITAEFYLKFWDMISEEFLQVLKEIEDTQSLFFREQGYYYSNLQRC